VGEEFGLEFPSRAIVERALAKPVKGVGSDFGEAPANAGAVIVLTLLHDVAAARAADLAYIELRQRIAPQDVPGIDTRPTRSVGTVAFIAD